MVVLYGLSDCMGQGSDDSRFWLNIGRGATVGSRFLGSATGASFSYSKASYIVSSRFLEAGNLVSQQTRTISELALLIGINETQQFTSLSGSIGLGYMLAKQDERMGGGSFTEWGFAVEIQTFLIITPIFGVGFYTFTNVNKEKSFGGIVLCLRVGKLR
ncbi:MAG: hypothetical protein HYY49_05810 [Ignavibacteriales bacterium]|nr:hypothetical protein [Ignavibacteriales bacterium]